MRDPFAGYDQWKTRCPEDEYPQPDEEPSELEDAYACIRLMGAALRECRKHFEGTDAPILKLIDEALS